MKSTVSVSLPQKPVRQFERMSLRNFLGLILLFETLLAFQGVDLCDEGFLATYYDNIFTHPESVTYNFMFWFTGLAGGAVAKMVPFLGLWGLRMAGAFCLVATVAVTYKLLEDFISPLSLKAGLLIVVLMHNNDIKVINYNTLSALCYVLIALFLFRGITEKKWLLLLVAGFLVSVNITVRLPNLTQLGLVAVIFISGCRQRFSLGTVVRECMAFCSGIILGGAALYLLMRALGHYQYVADSVGYLFVMSGQSTDAANNEGLYGISGMIKSFLGRNMWAVIYAALLFGGLVFLVWLRDFFGSRRPAWSKATGLLLYTLFGAILGLYIFRVIDSFNFLSLVIGIIYLLTALFVVTNRDRELEVLMLIAVFFFISYPVGSAYGIHSAGKFCLWLALPLGLDTLFRMRNTGGELFWKVSGQDPARIGFFFSQEQWMEISKLLVIVMITGGLVYQFFFPFYDWHNRLTMVHTVTESPRLKMIGTSASRAAVLNDLVVNSRKYIKEGEPVLAYDRMPGYFYATGYRSYLENPFSAVYGAAAFEHDLNKALQTHSRLPVVVQNLFRTSGNGSNWPDTFEEKDYSAIGENRDRNRLFNAFISKHRYREVWTNGLFRILVPSQTANPKN